MTSARLPRARRVFVRGLVLTILLVLVAAAAACPFAGRFLIVNEPLQPGDAIIVLAGEQVERWLEGADLYKEGLAPRLVLSPGYEEPLVEELRARGIRFPRYVEIQRDAVVQLGVPADAVEIMPGGYDNTADEAAGARRLAQERGWRRLIVVTSQYHTRRTAFAFQRELKDTGIEARVKGSRHDRISPNDWWKHRSDLRWVAMELQKLALYRLGLSK